MQGTAQEKPSKRGGGSEQLEIRLGFVVVLEGDGSLDLFVLGHDPRVLFVAVSVELGQNFEGFVGFVVVHEPSGTLREHEDKKTEEDCWYNLQTEGHPPLCAVVGNMDISRPRDPGGHQGAHA